jgi:hypothetical protein
LAHDVPVDAAEIDSSQMRRTLALSAVLLALVPIAFGILIVVSGYPPKWGPFASGAVAWTIALALRSPVALVGIRLFGSIERAQTLIVAASGPAEEIVRLIAVLVIGRDLATAIWLGFGWATIEVAYTFINGAVIARMANRTDPEAERVRQLIPPAAFGPSAPIWAALERTGVTAFHIGMTVIVAAAPITFLINAVVHSALNLTAVRFSQRWPIWALEGLICVVGFGALVVGLFLIGAF